MSVVPLGVMCREPETESRVCPWVGRGAEWSKLYLPRVFVPPPPWNSPMPADLGRRIAVP